MGDRYWVRHASLSGFAGPLSPMELGDAALPPDAEVRLARSDGRAETIDDRGWLPLHRVLGLAPPLPADPVIELPAPGIPGVRTDQVLANVRGKSSYRAARRLASGLLLLALLATAFALVTGLVEAWRARDVWMALVECTKGALQGAVAILAYQGFGMLADVADCHLRRETERAARSVAPASRDS